MYTGLKVYMHNYQLLLNKVKEEINWVKNHVVVPSFEESISTHSEGLISVYTYPFMKGPLDSVIIAFCKRYDVTLG